MYTLFFCLNVLKVKTAKAIGPNLCMATHVTPGKVFGGSKLKNFAQRQMLIFINFENAPN